MGEPITAIIAAVGFTIVTILIVVFLIKEGIKHYSGKKD